MKKKLLEEKYGKLYKFKPYIGDNGIVGNRQQ